MSHGFSELFAAIDRCVDRLVVAVEKLKVISKTLNLVDTWAKVRMRKLILGLLERFLFG